MVRIRAPASVVSGIEKAALQTCTDLAEGETGAAPRTLLHQRHKGLLAVAPIQTASALQSHPPGSQNFRRDEYAALPN